MKANNTSKYFIPCLTVLAASISQAYAAADGAAVVSGEVTPKLVYFNYTGGPGGGLTPYLKSYGGQDAWGGNRENGFYADVDLNLTVSNGKFDVLKLERQGFGIDNHRGRMRGGNEALGFTGYYSHFRTNSGGVDYLNRPGTANNPVATAAAPPAGYNAAGNAGYLTLFNDDSGGRADYKIERTRYGLGVRFKPDLLGKHTSLALNFDGYNREGNKFSTYVFGNGDITPNSAAQKQARWRGYNRPVDESMGRFSLNFTAAPGGMFQFAYDGSYEKFNSKARTALMTDFQAAIEANPALTLVGSSDLHFVPDTTLMTHAVRLSKNYGKTALAAGYGISRLKQDSYSNDQAAAGSGYSNGKISTENAFFNLNHRFSPGVGIEAHVKYFNRDNDSTKGVIGGSVLDQSVRDTWGVNIKNVETLNYGVAAIFSALPLKSSLTVGWKHEDNDRDLQYNTIPAPANTGVWPTVSLYKDTTDSDEFYLRWSARPMTDMNLRVTPSWVRANKTGFVTEAEESFNLTTALGFALTKQTHLNAYYNYKDKRNGNNSFFDTVKAGLVMPTTTTEYKQKADDTFHAAGLSLSHAPSEWTNLSGSLDWTQNDFATFFFGTNARRFESPIVFDQRGTSDYKVDTVALTLNADFQPSDVLKYRVSYTLSDSSGDLTTTSTATVPAGATAYAINDKIDNTLHSLAFGVDYELKSKLTLKGGYVYDRYKDRVFSNLNGGRHTLMMGVSVGF